MFTRIVECHVKPERKQEFENKLRNEVLPILEKQPGFVDLITLQPEDGGERQISLSFWNNKQDAERYQREQYSRIVDTIKPLLKREPQVQTYTVAHSSAHSIAASISKVA
jgi:heme-degrading monooxygenase HmoA